MGQLAPPLRVGAAINARSPNPTSLTDLARSFLPKELRGLLPQSSYLGTPQVAFAYERGWRDSSKRAGFPGLDEELTLAEGKILPFAAGKVLLDASCGGAVQSESMQLTHILKAPGFNP